MKRKKKSLPRNASQQSHSNSKDARSQDDASKKSKKSNGGSKTLRVATPQNSTLQFLENLGLVAPEGLDVDEIEVILDLTRASGREVGRQHSVWAAFHSYAIFVVARLETDLSKLQRQHKINLAKFRKRNSSKFKAKYELDDAALLDDELQEEADRIEELDRQLTLVRPLAESYEGFRNAASREMFRRSTETAQRE